MLIVKLLIDNFVNIMEFKLKKTKLVVSIEYILSKCLLKPSNGSVKIVVLWHICIYRINCTFSGIKYITHRSLNTNFLVDESSSALLNSLLNRIILMTRHWALHAACSQPCITCSCPTYGVLLRVCQAGVSIPYHVYPNSYCCSNRCSHCRF